MNIEPFDRGHPYMDKVRLWWKARERVPVSDVLFSDYGYMAMGDEGPVAALFYYPVKDCQVAMIGWPISDPDGDDIERDMALNELFDTIHRVASLGGYKMMWSFSGTPPVQSRLLDKGYMTGDTDINQYFRGL